MSVLVYQPLRFYYYILNRICLLLKNQTDKFGCNLSLFGSFLNVLSEFAIAEDTNAYSVKPNGIVSSCIEYIENNLSGDLSIENISANINFSPSSVAHTFKKEIGISIHKYVTQKRLFYAQTLLNDRTPPTETYALCGYSNYSSFYKAYVKAFGKRPKDY